MHKIIGLVAGAALLLGACGGSAGGAGGTGAAVPTGAPAVAATATPSGARWRPVAGQPWQWQLSGRLDTTVDVPTYDVDGAETTAAQVAALHAAGRHVICYFDAGAWEPYRADAAAFPAAVRGKPLDGYPDQRWLDIRRLDLLGPLLSRRFDSCRAKGFDAVETDDVDGYQQDTGFPLTAADQLAFDTWLAAAAHARGLSIALKNDLDQAVDLAPTFDFALLEQCVQYDECDAATPFRTAGKAVLDAEYQGSLTKICPTARRLGISAMRKHLSLDAFRQAC